MKIIPQDALPIDLKYESGCRGCGRSLRAGHRAYWSKSLKAVWCVDCRNNSSRKQPAERREKTYSRLKRSPSEERKRAASDGQQGSVVRNEWRQLCTYALRCIEAEAADSLAGFNKKGKSWFVHSGRERLIVGDDDSIAFPSALHHQAQAGKRDVSLLYGWPTVVLVLPGRENRLCVTPLFVVSVERQKDSDNGLILHAAMEPEFNVAITAAGGFDAAITEDVSTLVSKGLPFGDEAALESLAGDIAGQLGLQIHGSIRADKLDSDIGREQGIYNAAISVVAKWSGFTLNLRKELVELQTRTDWTRTAAACLLSNKPSSESQGSRSDGPLAAPLPCNDAQERTLGRLRRDTLTVVTGAPGTGKTQLVVNAVSNAWLDGEKVLVSSTNNRAVDVAVERADSDIGHGLLVRTGNTSAREELSGRLAAALERAHDYQTTHKLDLKDEQFKARGELSVACERRIRLFKQLSDLEKLNKVLLKNARKMKRVKSKLGEAAFRLWPQGGPASPLALPSEEVHHRASRLEKAWWLRRFRQQRLRKEIGCVVTATMREVAVWAKKDNKVTRLTALIDAGRRRYEELTEIIGDPSKRVSERDRAWAEASLRLLCAESASQLIKGKDRIQGLSRVSTKGHQFKVAIRRSFEHLKGWACTALTTNVSFQLEANFFDLVIIDEASQCSLAAVLPLAYRARRLCVVGDPYQLNPIIPVGDGILREIAEGVGLEEGNLRERGIHHKEGSAYLAFEYAAKPNEPVLLDEHYRCHPSIARWFNKTFYEGRLRVLTDISDSASRDRTIGWCDVNGQARRLKRGSWINERESEEAVKQIRRLVRSGKHSIGVVSPFTAQAGLIERLAERELGRDLLNEIEFVSGTAHRLQGDERDAIIFSSVVSPDMSRTTVKWVEKERYLVNVAVSRARRTLVVVGHPEIERAGSVTLGSLRRYLIEEAKRNEQGVETFRELRTDSESERRLLEAMQEADFIPYAKLAVEGYELDFALLEHGIKLNIEVDGDQHLDARDKQRRQDITRDRVLTKIGWSVMRIPAWRCHEDLEAVLAELRHERDRLAVAR